MNNILVAVELKTSDQQLVDKATQFAEKFNSKVWLIHIAAPDPDFMGYSVGPVYIRTMRANELRKEHIALQAMAKRIEAKSIEAEALLVQGPTLEMLKKEVDKLKIDLLVMGSHKHGFFYETWIGHTSVKAIKEVPIPVLIVPLDEAQ